MELLQAFTVSEDHAAQEAVWEQLPSYNRQPNTVRRLLVAGDMPATDRLARFVGLPVYEAAGGIVRRDLFAEAEGEQGTYICDPIKLAQLAKEKLAAAATELKADGWKWAEGIAQGIDHSMLRRFDKVEARNASLPEEMKAQLEELERQRDCRAKQMQDVDEEYEDAELLADKLQEIKDSIEAIQQNRPKKPRRIAGSLSASEPTEILKSSTA